MARADFATLTSLPWPLFIPVFFAAVIATAVILGELRLRTGSIWPGVVMHTAGGAVVNTLIVEGYLRFSGHGDALFSPAPNSAAFILLFSLVGVLLLRQARSLRRDPQRTGSPATGSDARPGQPAPADSGPDI